MIASSSDIRGPWRQPSNTNEHRGIDELGSRSGLPGLIGSPAEHFLVDRQEAGVCATRGQGGWDGGQVADYARRRTKPKLGIPELKAVVESPAVDLAIANHTTVIASEGECAPALLGCDGG
jgi:hypothetical protein